jgi:hypothetical protein
MLNLFALDGTAIIGLVLSLFIPLLTSLLARAQWPSEIQSLITLALGTATGFFTEWAAAGTEFDWRTALGLSLGSLLIAIAARYGFWRETPLDAKLLSVGSKTDVAVNPLTTPVIKTPVEPPAPPA